MNQRRGIGKRTGNKLPGMATVLAHIRKMNLYNFNDSVLLVWLSYIQDTL